MPLYFLGTQSRFASGAEADALLAQSWTLMPDKPSFNPVTHVAEWDNVSHQWVVRALAQDELDATALQQIRAELKGFVNELEAWAADAEETVDNPAKWDAWNATQRFAALKVTIKRLGKFMRHTANIIKTA